MESERQSLPGRLREEAARFRERYAKPNRAMEILYFLSMGCYLLQFQSKLIAWSQGLRSIGDVSAMLFLDAAFLLALLWLTMAALLWSSRIPVIVLAAVCDGLIMRLWPTLEYEVRIWIINGFLILGAAGRDYRKVLRTFLVVFALGFAVAVGGLFLGYSYEHLKWQDYGKGFALGYSNANNMSRFVLWMAMLLWLLRLHKNKAATAILFGAVFLLAAFLARCRTVAVMAVLIPLMTWGAEWLYFRQRLPDAGKKLLSALVIATPFLMLLLSLALSYAVIPWVPRFRHTAFWNLLVRFVQNNIALQEYGIHLTGRNVDFLGNVVRIINGERMALLILDNAYVPWLIRNGLIRMALLLSLLSLALYKAVRQRDLPLLAAFVGILIYGLMEPAALQVQYNFAFLYLLADGRRAVAAPGA